VRLLAVLFANNDNELQFMATIQKRANAEGETSFRVRIRLRGQPMQTCTFHRLTDAREWAQQTEAAIREGRYFKTAEAKKHTVAELIDRYLKILQQRKPQRYEGVKPYLFWWRDQIGVYLLSEVTRAMIIEKRDILTQGNVINKKITKSKRAPKLRSPATANRYMVALSTAFTMAVNEWEWLQDHPMGRIAKLQEPRGRVRFLDDDERAKLLDACRQVNSKHLYFLVVLALSTGARHGELITLHWRNVDFKRNVIVLHDTKNKERRVLPLAHHALELIVARYQSRDAVTDLVFPSPYDPKRPWESQASWKTAVDKAGLEDFRFHDLRHSAASYLAMNGASLAEIAEVLGHKTLAMVKRYAHLSEAHTAKVVERMNQKIFG
jgi:integrase